MYLLINQQLRQEIDSSTLQVVGSASDPIPTCQLVLIDTGSVVSVAEFQEVVVIDEQTIANPAHNILRNATLNPYTTIWQNATVTGLTLSQNIGGGVIITAANAANAASSRVFQLTYDAADTNIVIPVTVPGQNYMASCFMQGSSATGFQGYIEMAFQDISNTTLLDVKQLFSLNNTNQRFSLQAVAPAGTSHINVSYGAQTNSGTNSGTLTITQAQLEPTWFTPYGQSYPSPFCDASQANCWQLANGTTIRQSRVFAGFITKLTYENYAGFNREIVLQASGPAWLADCYILIKTYTSQTDKAIILDIVSLSFSQVLTTTHVQTGYTFSSLVCNGETERAIIDNLASVSTFRWYIDPYYDVWYLPNGFYSMPFTLSDKPDNVNSFVYSNYSREVDFTQPCNTAYVQVAGGSTYVTTQDQGSFTYYGSLFFTRLINETAITNNTDAFQRGLAEVMAYGYGRVILHLETDIKAAQPLTPGNAVTFINTVEGIGPDTYLIQKVTVSLKGTDQTGVMRWLYQADLGTFNPDLTTYLAKTARNSLTTNTPLSSTPAVQNLCVIESINTQDFGPSAYELAVMAASPTAYYRLGDFSGTQAYDATANDYNGTLSGGVALMQEGAIARDSDFAMRFDGTGAIALPSGLNPSGWTAISLEYWVYLESIANAPAMLGTSTTFTTNKGFVNYVDANTGQMNFYVGKGTSAVNIFTSGAFPLNQWVYVVVTCNTSTINVYLNGALNNSAASTLTSIAADVNPISIGQIPGAPSTRMVGSMDEVAIYNAVLSASTVRAHYQAGGTGYPAMYGASRYGGLAVYV